MQSQLPSILWFVAGRCLAKRALDFVTDPQDLELLLVPENFIQ